jgi:ribosomal protein S12 methylthiotransferase accessory factor
MPKRTPLASMGASLEACVRRIEASDARVHLFNVTNDYRVPVFGAIILDLSGDCCGSFSGYGAHLNAEVAAARAISEAAQARCCYISGARDDLFRRQFLFMKRIDQAKVDQMFNELEPGSLISEFRTLNFPDVKTELRYLLKFIRQFGVTEVYVKELGSYLDGAVQVVRVISPQCEPFRFDHWTPGFRCINYAHRKMKALKEKEKEGENWKTA